MKWKLLIPIVILGLLICGYFLGKPLLKYHEETGIVASTSEKEPRDRALLVESTESQEIQIAPKIAGLPDEQQNVYSTSTYGYESRVIKSASLEVKVEKDQVRPTLDKVKVIAEKRGGFVQSSQMTKWEDYQEGYILINVPENEFSGALKDLESLGEVLSSRVSGKEVTQEYHDLELDLSHWETERQAVLALLDKATTIDEIIKIRQFLEPIDREINQIKGRLQYLKSKTDFSSIEMTIRENSKPVKVQDTIWTKIWGVFIDSLTGVLAFLAAATPFLLLTGFIVYLIWLVVRQYRKKRMQVPPSPPSS